LHEIATSDAAMFGAIAAALLILGMAAAIAAAPAIKRAEAMSGRSVNKQVIGQGAHSHDNGRTWHDHKG